MKKRNLPILALAAVFSICAATSCNASPDGASLPENSGGESSVSFAESDTAEKNEIIVRFSTDGGSRVEDRTLWAGEILDLSGILSARPDALFLGWYLDETLTMPAPDLLRPQKSLTLYAKWHIEKVLVVFETFGGGEVPTLTGRAGDPIAPPQPPAREGFAFEGWYEEGEYRTPYVFTVFPETDLTLYAKWRALQKDVEITLHLNSPLGISSGEAEFTTSLLCDEGEPLRAEAEIELFRRRVERQIAESGGEISYEFAGWAYEAAGTIPFGGIVPLAPDGLDLYAVWLPKAQPGDAGEPEG